MNQINVLDHLADVKVRELNIKDIQEDYKYILANKIVDDLLDNDLINEKEAKEIKRLNKQTFTPIYIDLID